MRTLVASNGLSGKVLRGGAWIAAGSYFEQLFRFLRSIILTRLLAPEAFGAMAVVLSAATLVDSLTDVGAKEALIQNPRGGEKLYLDAAWWIVLIRGLAIYLAIFTFAPRIGRFYGNADFTWLIRVSFLSIVFTALLSSKTYLAIKNMSLAKAALINNGGGIAGIVITVVVATIIRDSRALAIGYCAESVTRCVLSYIICPHLPSIRVDRKAVRDLLKFSRGLFGLSFLNFVFARADVFVLAKLYSAEVVGVYSMALYLVQTPSSSVITILNQCLYPAYSQISKDFSRMNRVLLRVTGGIALGGLPAIAFICFTNRSLLTIVYGSKYAVVSAALSVAAIIAVINVANSQITIFFYSLGRPYLHRMCVIIMALSMVICVYPFSKLMGPLGAQLAALLSISLGYCYQINQTRIATDLEPLQYGKRFLIPAVTGAGLLAICLGAQSFRLITGSQSILTFGVIACVLACSVGGVIHFRTKLA